MLSSVYLKGMIFMSQLRGACIIGQSGGPSSAINASAYGAIKTALDSDAITQVLGACNGIKGVLDDNLIDMGKEDPSELALMKYRSSRSTMSAISSTTAATTPWTPATRSPSTCSRTAMSAA